MKFFVVLRQVLLQIPTTKLRIIVSILLSILVVIRATFTGFMPSWELLGFLLIQQGLDISQYAVRRRASAPGAVEEDEENADPERVNSDPPPDNSEKG